MYYLLYSAIYFWVNYPVLRLGGNIFYKVQTFLQGVEEVVFQKKSIENMKATTFLQGVERCIVASFQKSYQKYEKVTTLLQPWTWGMM